LSGLEADILVTHKAPSAHRYGFVEIDELAELMGVQLIIHGHHHEQYAATTESGIKVVGLGGQDCLFVIQEHAEIKVKFC
jgi:predicted phosphodiesterase